MAEATREPTSTDEVLSLLGMADDTAAEPFEPRLVTAQIVSASPDVALLRRVVPGGDELGEELIMPVTEWASNRPWSAGERVQVLQLEAGPRALVSTARREIVEALLADVCPEVRAGQVRVMGVAREPGMRTKVAVAAVEGAGDERVDPIASCVGRGANRVRYVSAKLGGEQIDIVAWHPTPEAFLRSALQPASVDRVEIDAEEGKATAFVPAHQMPAAVGGGGLNSQLAGQLVGLAVTIEPSR